MFEADSGLDAVKRGVAELVNGAPPG